MTTVRRIPPDDAGALRQADLLLRSAGIRRDASLEYIAGVTDDAGRLLAVGGFAGNTLRSLAVDPGAQGEGLLAALLSHLIEKLSALGRFDLFVTTKPSMASRFSALGFHEVARVPGVAALLENRRGGFAAYVEGLKRESARAAAGLAPGHSAAAVVMNANPLTLGHLALVERAVAENDLVHVLVVSEDRSAFPFAARMALVKEAAGQLPRVVVHGTGPYLVSSATFPSYFQKDAEEAAASHALLDSEIFVRIAGALSISTRYVGEEPFSAVTRQYNEAMAKRLGPRGIGLRVIPRLAIGGQPVSASAVRALLARGDLEGACRLVPAATRSFLLSDAAKPILAHLAERRLLAALAGLDVAGDEVFVARGDVVLLQKEDAARAVVHQNEHAAGKAVEPGPCAAGAVWRGAVVADGPQNELRAAVGAVGIAHGIRSRNRRRRRRCGPRACAF